VKRKPIMFLFVQFFCENCGYYFVVKKNDLMIDAQDSERYGSDVTFLNIKCPKCDNIKDVKAKGL